jgi:hypothetical protein
MYKITALACDLTNISIEFIVTVQGRFLEKAFCKQNTDKFTIAENLK